jgi:hypothetical protein
MRRHKLPTLTLVSQDTGANAAGCGSAMWRPRREIRRPDGG